MRRTLGVATILCMALGGAALAGHGGGGGPVVRDHRGGGGPAPAQHGPVVRDHRGGGGPAPVQRGPVVRDHRGGGPAPRMAHVRVSNGHYMFPGGVVRVYHRPVIREHYYNVHMRPPLIVEAYDPVPGYAWVRGGWTWGRGEWMWTPGYWNEAAEEPVVGGGVSVSAGVSIH